MARDNKTVESFPACRSFLCTEGLLLFRLMSLRELGLFSQERRKLQGELSEDFQYLKGLIRKVGSDFSVEPVMIEQGVVVLN